MAKRKALGSQKQSLTVEEFVRLWQKSESLREAAKGAGISPASVASRACYLRKKGVRLKRMNGVSRPRIDADALNKLIDELGFTDE